VPDLGRQDDLSLGGYGGGHGGKLLSYFVEVNQSVEALVHGIVKGPNRWDDHNGSTATP
jgi:hypothetical protein